MEIIGYIATAFVLYSFTTKSLDKLRLFSCYGSFLFVIYGIGIKSYPIIITNALIFLINTTKISGQRTTKYSSFEDRINNKGFTKNEDKN